MRRANSPRCKNSGDFGSFFPSEWLKCLSPMGRKDGRKVATWQPPGIDPATRKKYTRRYYFKETQAEADQAKADDQAEFADPAPVSTSDDVHTLAVALWEPRFEHNRPNTIRRYTDAYKRHVRPKFGHRLAKDIRPADVQLWVNEMSRAGVAPASVTLYVGILSSILKLAAAEGVIGSNPASVVRKPKIPKRIRAVPPSRVRDLLTAVDGTELAAPVFLAAVLGLSRGEACGLKWETIDRPTCRISIVGQRLVRQGETTGKSIGEGPTKRESRVRAFVLPPALFEAMERYVNQDGNYLCVSDNGRPWNPEHLTWAWAKIRDGLGFTDWHFHDLRHAAAGVLAYAGVDLLTIAAILGHSTIDTTALYSAVQEATATRGFASVSEVLFPVEKR